MQIPELIKTARKVRIDIINEVYSAQSGHPGGSLSAADIVTALYFEIMDAPCLTDTDRDKFILSKGHASPLLYAVLAERGVIDKSELSTFRALGSHLQGHPDMNKTPGVDMTAGSLGVGVSTAVGFALAGKLRKDTHRIYTLLGDGEIQEGSVWEAFMAAAHYKLDNLTVIIDNNNLQIDGQVCDVMSPYPIDEKLKAFGFSVYGLENGNDMAQVVEVLARARKDEINKPVAIIAKTVKGKGVSFMENNAGWHGKAPNAEEYAKAIAELEVE